MTISLKRLMTTILLVLVVGAAVIVGLFLSTFDLNQFRGEISDSISSRISQPVVLGQAHFSLKHGPSFAFENVRVGTRSGPLSLSVEHVFFRLEVMPLFEGRFRFSEILFENPELVLEIGPTKTTEPAERRLMVDQSLIFGDLVRSVRIRDGHVRIVDRRDPGNPFVITLEQLKMVVDDISLRRSGQVEIQADINLNDIRSPLSLKGSITASDSTPFWNFAHYDLELSIRDLASDLLTQRYRKALAGFEIRGRTDIAAQVAGTPADGLTFRSSVRGRDLGLKLPGRTDAIQTDEIAASGIWQKSGSLHKLAELDLTFGSINLLGDMELDRSRPEPEISFSLRAPRIALTELNPFLKPVPGSSEDLSAAPLKAGTLRLSNLEYAGPVADLGGLQMLPNIRGLEFEVLQGALSLAGVPALDNINLDVGWDNRKLVINTFEADTARIHVRGDGDLRIDQGGSPGAVRLKGRQSLNIRNSDQVVAGEEWPLPENGLNASLHFDARYAGGFWTFADNLLALPSIRMILQGRYERGDAGAYAVDISVPEFSLQDLPLISPAVEAIHPDGRVAANIRYRGGKKAEHRLTGTIDLDRVHLHVLGPLADLDALSGTIHLNWPALRSEEMSAKLGTSPIILDLDIPDLTRPRVNLAIRGDSIRADELIFRSEKIELLDVDARVSITDGALLLGPIHTRMAGGTNVTINGTIDNFPKVDTRLTIEGAYANIDEVIGLWISENHKEGGQRRKRDRGVLEIDIRTEKGEIANLPFEQCESHISLRDRTLVIHPISFKSGPGFGLGQVLVEFRDEQPPLLKMSGHLEEFDALAVYQQMLQRKGIVTGRLRGDFYLEGTAGDLKDVFLPSSTGSFNFVIRDGVLKKLRALSKTLTLFNIYPLFTSSDSSKGVPFEKLTGNAFLDKGVLKSDNMFLKGDVMNMSLTGSQNLITGQVDIELGVMPLRTIDRLVTKIPLAGWILAGEDKALVTAHFRLTGPAEDPKITPIPVESASKQVLGVFERLFTLPVKIINDVGKTIE